VSGFWAWAGLAGLGAFHGVNPAMGWLFAVAIGLQRRSRAAVLWALVPIGLGHGIAVALTISAALLLRPLVGLDVLKVLAASALIVFGLWRLTASHRGRAGMQVGFLDLVFWSFLMATAHGAGLMVLPVLLELPSGEVGLDSHGIDAHAAHGPHAADPAGMGVSEAGWHALAALGIHSAAMVAVSAAVAVAVYSWIGLAFLRRGWINLDRLWALALIGIGGLSLIVQAL